MLPFILGGVALAVTGFGIKKYLEDEDNCRKVEDTVDCFINNVEKQIRKLNIATLLSLDNGSDQMTHGIKIIMLITNKNNCVLNTSLNTLFLRPTSLFALATLLVAVKSKPYAIKSVK